LFLSDFTGSHTLTIPVALSVLGMSAFFDWDWTTGGKTVNAITGYTLTNRGGKPITFTHVKLQDWWQCDLSHSYWEQMEVDGGVIFSGSLQDGNTADTSDVTLPVLTSYSDNTLVFNDNIQDDNETFRAVVTFSDGSEYTSASFGPGCTGDVTPPATVTDLIVVPGAEPGTVAITFTYPGDDNYTGNAVYATLKKSEAVIDSEVDWNGATTLTWPGPLPLPAGGTAGSFVVADQMAGLSRYWSIRFEDENGNMSGLSNSPKQRPWNEYRFTGGDFNFSYFASSYPGSSTPVGISDVNKMRLHQIQLGDAVTFARIAFRIVEDVNTGNVWAAAVDMNATDINRVRFWYPAPANYLSTSANYDTAKSLPISGGVDLIDSIEFPSNRRYNGIRVGMGVPNDLYLDVVLGIIDFNMSHNMTEGTDPYDTGGSDV
ncbi:MAG: hypothetical protein U1C71_04095, partial [archaeon]|nr:hypothetical protein [archaeon]